MECLKVDFVDRPKQRVRMRRVALGLSSVKNGLLPIAGSEGVSGGEPVILHDTTEMSLS